MKSSLITLAHAKRASLHFNFNEGALPILRHLHEHLSEAATETETISGCIGV